MVIFILQYIYRYRYLVVIRDANVYVYRYENYKFDPLFLSLQQRNFLLVNQNCVL